MKRRITVVFLTVFLIISAGIHTVSAYSVKAVTLLPDETGKCSLEFALSEDAELYTYSCRLCFDTDKLDITEIIPKLFMWDVKKRISDGAVYYRGGQFAGCVFISPDVSGAKLIVTSMGQELPVSSGIAEVRFKGQNTAAVVVTDEKCAAVTNGAAYETSSEKVYCTGTESAASIGEFYGEDILYSDEAYVRDGSEKITVSLAGENKKAEIKGNLCVLKPDNKAEDNEIFRIFSIDAVGIRTVSEYAISEDNTSLLMKAGGYGDYFLKRIKLPSELRKASSEADNALIMLIGRGILNTDEITIDKVVTLSEAYGAVRKLKNGRQVNMADSSELKNFERYLAYSGKRAEDVSKSVTRGEFAGILFNEGFIPNSEYEELTPIELLNRQGIIVGDEDGDIMPDAELTITQLAVILDRVVTNKIFI
ncbi:MAG: hypothetical protein ACI4DY_08965 [Monoglobaceae bacterium]